MTTREYPKSVTLKDGRSVALRPLACEDFGRLHEFFVALPQEDRIFLRHDVTDPEVVRKWTDGLDLNRVFPLVALDGEKIVADGTLHTSAYGWTRHVGQLRLVTARSHRHQGLGALIARELVDIARERNLEKLQAQVIEDDAGALKMLDAVGFKQVAVLKDTVKDVTFFQEQVAQAALTLDAADEAVIEFEARNQSGIQE